MKEFKRYSFTRKSFHDCLNFIQVSGRVPFKYLKLYLFNDAGHVWLEAFDN